MLRIELSIPERTGYFLQAMVLMKRHGLSNMQLRLAALVLAWLWVLPAGLAHAATIGVSIPLSGDAAELGQKFRIGAKLAMEKYGSGHELFIADDGCDADLAAVAADDLEANNSAIVVGMICNASAKAVASKFAGTAVPSIVAGARSIRLIKDREREEWNLWRLSPGDDYPVEVAANSIADQWSGTPYAIVDDGTIYGRSFTDTIRLQMDEAGLKPQFSDTFRAAQSTQAGLLRRLQRSGVSAAFIASASVEDLFTIARNMQDFDINLQIMTTEALAVLPYLEEARRVPSGVQVIMAPMPYHEELELQLAELETATDRQIYLGYAAIQVALQAMSADDPTPALTSETFETVLGEVTFGDNGSSSYNPYQTHIWDGEALITPGELAETQ